VDTTLTYLLNKSHQLDVHPLKDVRVVCGVTTNIRSQSNIYSAILFTLTPGTEVSVIDIDNTGKWLHIRCWKGFGWIYEPLAKVVE
jgi:hypothetical protein